MKKTVIITRYSDEGFMPKYQSHHLKLIDYHLNGFNIARFPAHIRPMIFKRHLDLKKAYLKNRQFVKYGTWCFISGYERLEEITHLTHFPKLFKARITANTMVYTKLLDKKIPITSAVCKEFGFFIQEEFIANTLDEWQVTY